MFQYPPFGLTIEEWGKSQTKHLVPPGLSRWGFFQRLLLPIPNIIMSFIQISGTQNVLFALSEKISGELECNILINPITESQTKPLMELNPTFLKVRLINPAGTE